jgi:salicylate hydroxylase
VIGAGMGGLSAALGLLRQGHEVHILEQAPAFGEIGAGVTVGAGATLALDYLGLGPVFRDKAETPGRTTFIHYRTMEPIPGQLTATQSANRPIANRIHRADLHEILAQAVTDLAPGCVTFGAVLAGVEQTATSAACILADGSRVEGDVVIGADGLRSVTRRALFGPDMPRFTGKVAWRCLIPYPRIADYLRHRLWSIFVGPDSMLSVYSVRQGSQMSIAAMVRTDCWTEEATRAPSTIEELLPFMPDWHPDIAALLREAPPETVNKWALFDYDPMKSWVVGRIALLGDAAHPMLPFLGAGASMAIEDGVLLSRAFAGHLDIKEALARYERARIPRTTRMMLASRSQGDSRGKDPNHYLTDSPFRDDSILLYNPAEVAF